MRRVLPFLLLLAGCAVPPTRPLPDPVPDATPASTPLEEPLRAETEDPPGWSRPDPGGERIGEPGGSSSESVLRDVVTRRIGDALVTTEVLRIVRSIRAGEKEFTETVETRSVTVTRRSLRVSDRK